MPNTEIIQSIHTSLKYMLGLKQQSC